MDTECPITRYPGSLLTYTMSPKLGKVPLSLVIFVYNHPKILSEMLKNLLTSKYVIHEIASLVRCDLNHSIEMDLNIYLLYACLDVRQPLFCFYTNIIWMNEAVVAQCNSD